jgi:putative protease
MTEQRSGEKRLVGRVVHYFGKIGVAAVELTDRLRVGDTILVEGAAPRFEQVVESMQIEKSSVQEAEAGQAVGIKVKDKVREGDRVYVIS